MFSHRGGEGKNYEWDRDALDARQNALIERQGETDKIL